MWKRIECVAIYTEDIEASVEFYQQMGLTKTWDTFQDDTQHNRLVGLTYPEGGSQLVLKNNPNLHFIEIEIMVDDVVEIYNRLSEMNKQITWIRKPFNNLLGGHVAVMQAPDQNVFVLVGK
ncbi:VOC family protein [Cytobacillus suaedae]|nr:VOC family protein [Cytobacillus suaedae]